MSLKLSSLGWSALTLLFFYSGLVQAASGLPVRGETRDVSGFHALASNGSIHVEVRFGNRESVRLEGDEAAIREIETVVEQGTLKIGFKKQAWTRNANWGKVTAYVTARKIDALSQSGSGHIVVSGKVSGDALNAALSGSGRITVSSEVQVFNASISGSGRIVASGDVRNSNVSISGSGRLDGGNLRSRSANLKISGSGNISIHVDEQLDAVISGSGNVSYSGNAQTNVRTSGSGRVRKS
ncbi:head GIN domain-containing protein [Parapedobacter deserti]|uniref:Head GIN domain-containing protein n=1 Tax=Parapedobacter deserti TaxID=1912957 RepID=A0ABV7JFE2_9SPHI